MNKSKSAWAMAKRTTKNRVKAWAVMPIFPAAVLARLDHFQLTITAQAGLVCRLFCSSLYGGRICFFHSRDALAPERLVLSAQGR